MRQPLNAASATTSHEPLGRDEFAALMHEVSAGQRPAKLAVAVSGGPDSMALAFMLKRWAVMESVAEVEILAFIVDHKLRPESGNEATATQKALTRLGIAAEILCWEHTPVVTRLHITARKARYRLLLDACRQYGITHLLFAHQREDQAETILMRFAKGSGIDGLAGIPAVSRMDGITIWRPLLPVAKERLIATCAAENISYVSDPNNHATKFARGRLRRVMPLLADEGFSVERLIDLGTRAAAAKEALDHYVSLFLHAATTMDAAGVIDCDLALLRAAPCAIAERALSLCLQTIHAEDYAAEHTSLAALCEALRHEETMHARTLHGCRISKSATHATLMREVASIADPQILRAGETTVWDQRWQVNRGPTFGDEPLTLRPLGHPPHDVLDLLSPGLRHHVPRGRVRAALPALWRNETLVAAPSLALSGTTNGLTARLITPWPPTLSA